MPNGLNCEERRSGLADDGAFIFDNRMAGSEAKPTPERPTDDACERRVVAELSPTLLSHGRGHWFDPGTTHQNLAEDF